VRRSVIFFFSVLLFLALPAHSECVERRDMSLYFAIDISASMEGSNLTVARNFAVKLLDELGTTGTVDEAAAVQFCAVTVFTSPWTTTESLRNDLAAVSVTCAHPDLVGYAGTSLYDAIIETVSVLRTRTSPIKLHVVITDGGDTTSVSSATEATAALSPSGIIGRLIFVGGGSGSLQAIANDAGSHIEYAEATSGNISIVVNEILDATCSNFRPNASFTISDNDLHLGTEGFNITFNPSGSSDDGSISSFAWLVTRPDGSTFEVGGNPLLQTFNDNQLSNGENWSARLTVTDNKGSTDVQTQSFRVIGTPPSVSISGAPEMDIDVLEVLRLEATPTADVDGGNITFQWHIDSRPATAENGFEIELGSGPFAGFATFERDIGTWLIRAVGTDDEGDTDEEQITVNVLNLPPEINFVGLDDIDIGDSIEIETTILDDVDGGTLSFEWDIVQSPDPSGVIPQEGYAGGSGAAGAMLSIPTSASDAGTWIVRLTATDNDNQPNSSVSEEFTVLVDAPVEAIAGGPEAIGSLSFPLVLTSESSTDPDTDAPHSTLDGRPVVLSPGIVERLWALIDVPFDLWDQYPLGRVDEIFAVPAGEVEMELDFFSIDTGQWLFQVDVTDGEGNEASGTHSVIVTDENTAPTALTNGVSRYLVQAGTNVLNADIVLDGSASFDFDDILPDGDDGIESYIWSVDLAPPACALPAIPDGAISLLFAGGSVIPLECHGLWRLMVTVTDLDSPAKTGTGTVEVVIGNCPEPLCIDHPTTFIPELVEFTDDTDVTIVYHLDSAIYNDPRFSVGMIAQVAIFHESDLITPFYSDYDFNVLPTDAGGMLVFHWNGYSNGNLRPTQGLYTIRISLFDGVSAATGFDTLEADSISIAVAEPHVLPTSDPYKNVDRLDDGTELLRIDWDLTGAAVADQMVWRLRDASSALVYEEPLAPATSGTVLWNGRIGGTPISPGAYTTEVGAFRLGVSLGTSQPYPIVLYRITTQTLSGIHPSDPERHFLLVNNDDDNANALSDTSDSSVIGENDLGESEIIIEPLGVDLRAVLDASSGAANVKVWNAMAKGANTPLPITYDLGSETPPVSVFLEGVDSGETVLSWALQKSDGTLIEEVTIPLSIADVDLDADTNMIGGIGYDDDLAEMNDLAIIIDVNNNDTDVDGLADSLDRVINGAADKTELTILTLRRNSYVPAGGRMVLRVSNKEKIRLFDDTDTAVIGPPAVDGGPDLQEFDIPTARITAGDLTYRIETVHPDLSTISLILFDGATELARDELKAALNVTREPGNAYEHIRNRVYVSQSVPDIRGIEANLTGAKPIVSWAPSPPVIKTTSYWVSIQDNTPLTGWLQTGVRAIRATDGTTSDELYFEFVPDYPSYKAGSDPHGYLRLIKSGDGWRDGTFGVEKLGAALDTGEVWLNGLIWESATHPNLPSVVFSNYQIGTEPKQSVSRNPGSTAAKAVVSAAQFRDAAGWQPTTFLATDIWIYTTDGRGNVAKVTAASAATSAVNDHFHFNWLTGQSYEHWDDR
jgi:hypothetical protein